MLENHSSRWLLACLLIFASGCSDRGMMESLGDAGPSMEPDAELCAIACGPSGACCGEGEECISDLCLPTCGDNNRCGEDESICCGSEELCVNDACTLPGEECIDDIDCPEEQYCDLGMNRCLPQPDEGRECRYIPPQNEFTPEVVWEWNGGSSSVAPLVAPLEDENGDGIINGEDGTDIITVAFFPPSSGPCSSDADCETANSYCDRSRGECLPEWNSIRETTGRIVALDGASGRELWRSQEGIEVCHSATPAVADLDGDGVVEIVTVVASESSDPDMAFSRCGGWFNAFLHPLSLAIFSGDDGSLEAVTSTDELKLTGHHAPSLSVGDVDLDGDGEIAVQGALIDHLGNVVWQIPGSYDDPDTGYGWFVWPGSDMTLLADVDSDPELEFIHPHGVWNHDGTPRWMEPLPDGSTAVNIIGRVITDRPEYPGGQFIRIYATSIEVYDAASGDLMDTFLVEVTDLADSDGDGYPDICDSCNEFGAMHDSDSDGTTDCAECVDFLGRGALQPAPAAFADFDGDGIQELGYALGTVGAGDYVVVDLSSGQAVVESRTPLLDGSYASVASTVFDFDGNGSAEILTQDECHVRIRSGVDGSTLWAASNSSVTVSEYPVVADVTGNGQANLIVASNGIRSSRCADRDFPFTQSTNGIRVYRDSSSNWISARSIWNQHGYHIDHIREDGSLPTGVRGNWESHNTFRLNRYPNPETVFHAPDLVPTTISTQNGLCWGEAEVSVRVVNRGYRTVPAGIRAVFYADTGDGPTAVGEAYTTDSLGPGDGVWLVFEVEPGDLPLDDQGRATLSVEIDDIDPDATGRGRFNECDEMNNGLSVELDCGLI